MMPGATRKFCLILLAGLAGGLAETGWIGIYSTVTQSGGWEVARQITASLIPAWSETAIAPVLGVGMHLVLSVLLAFLCCQAFLKPLVRHFGPAVIMPGCIALLASVWAVNFLVIMPAINPAFVSLLPFLVTFTSKMLFGWAMGTVLTQGFVETVNRPA